MAGIPLQYESFGIYHHSNALLCYYLVSRSFSLKMAFLYHKIFYNTSGCCSLYNVRTVVHSLYRVVCTYKNSAQNNKFPHFYVSHFPALINNILNFLNLYIEKKGNFNNVSVILHPTFMHTRFYAALYFLYIGLTIFLQSASHLFRYVTPSVPQTSLVNSNLHFRHAQGSFKLGL